MDTINNLKDIAIYGAGGLGREVACLLRHINEEMGPTWNLIGFFDDGKFKGEEISHFGLALGGLDELNAWPTDLNIVLCFGNPSTIHSIKTKITNPKISFPNIISPDFAIADPETFSIGVGNIISGKCSTTTNTKLGSHNLLNGQIAFGHDVCVGDFNVFMPGSRISGEVIIGNCNLFGADSFIKQQLKIGNKIVLSPLSALLTRPKDGNLYIGNPAKIFKY